MAIVPRSVALFAFGIFSVYKELLRPGLRRLVLAWSERSARWRHASQVP